MEKNNKYYDLIIKLIKENKKFAGNESILEDIADDVYNHAKVVLNSVTNEDVVSAYLEKVISTSIITVAKKLNHNSRLQNSSALEAIMAARKAAAESKAAMKQYSKPVNTELVDKMINGVENIASETEPVVIAEQEVQFVQETAASDTKINADESLEENLTSDTVILKPEPEYADLEIEETEQETLNIPEEDVIEEISTAQTDFEQNNEIYNLEEDDGFNSEQPEVVNNTESEVFSENLNDIYSIPQENLQDNDILNTDVLEEQELSENEELQVSTEDEDTLTFTDINSAELVSDTDIFESSETQVSDILFEKTPAEDFDLMDEQPLLEENIQEDYGLRQDTETEELFDITADQLNDSEPKTKELSFAGLKPDYTCFDYIPDSEREDWDEEYVLQALSEINKKDSEVDIFKVYELRYNNGYTVKAISKELGLNEEQVLDTLVEISLLVKDS